MAKFELNCMRPSIVLAGALIMGTFSVLLTAEVSFAGTYITKPKPITDQYIVIYYGQATDQQDHDLDKKASLAEFQHGAKIKARWKKAVRGFVARMSKQEALKLAAQPEVALVEEDGVHSKAVSQTGAPWSLDRIDQVALPLDGTYNAGVDGRGVNVYVIDTGVRSTHQELAGKVAPGFTSVNDGYGTEDCDGHGTHVAGIIAGSTYGVAKGATIVPVRVLDCTGTGLDSGIVAGIDWVTSQKTQLGINAVANMSLSGSPSGAINTAVINSIAAGVTYTVAAGNLNYYACLYSPGNVVDAITVGASTATDQKMAYSNFGSCIDIWAPGDAVTSSFGTSDTAVATLTGTSMAAPHVAGAAALYLSANPGATPAQVTAALTTNASSGVLHIPVIINTPAAISPNRLLNISFIKPIPDTIAPTVRLISPTAGTTLQGSLTLTADAIDQVGGSGIAKVEFFIDNTSIGSITASPYQLIWNSATVLDGTHQITVKATDLAGNIATSTATSIFLSNGVIPPPVACSTSAQILINSDFEAAPQLGWTSNNVLISKTSSYPSHGGEIKALFNGNPRGSVSTLSQMVTIPANACAANLSFWYRVVSSEPAGAGAMDKFTVSIYSSTGTLLKLLATYSNTNNSILYQQASFNLAAFKGKTIEIRFKGVEGVGRPTTFLLDDTSLIVTK